MHPAAQPELYATRVDASGRLLVPAVLRKRFGLEPGTRMTLAVAPGSDTLTLVSRAGARRAAQAYVTSLRAPGELWSEELIAERRSEAEREYGPVTRHHSR